jgi:hypothetical protein
MTTRWILPVLLAASAALQAGCTGDVSTTPNSVKIEGEVPKIEVKKTPDLDPRTDDDVDVKTPTP